MKRKITRSVLVGERLGVVECEGGMVVLIDIDGSQGESGIVRKYSLLLRKPKNVLLKIARLVLRWCGMVCQVSLERLVTID